VRKASATTGSASKISKTVLSWMTQMRNLIGQPFFNLQNGHYRISNYGKAFKAVAADIGVSDSRKWRRYYNKLLRLGVIGDEARAEEQARIAELEQEFLQRQADIREMVQTPGGQFLLGKMKDEYDYWLEAFLRSNPTDQAAVAAIHAKLHTFREWIELLSTDKEIEN